MRAWFAKLMMGRNGVDALNRFLLVILGILLAVQTFLRGTAAGVMGVVTLALLFYLYFRMFSRNIYKRQTENGAYLRMRYRVTSAWSGRKDRWSQRKEYRFFKCPSCRTRLRVPRGKGKINIVCRKCGTSFQRRT